MYESNMISLEDYIVDSQSNVEKEEINNEVLTEKHEEKKVEEIVSGEVIPLTSQDEGNTIDLNKYSYQYRTDKENKNIAKKNISPEILTDISEFLSNKHKKLFQESIIDKKKRQNLSVIISDFISSNSITVPGYSADELIKSVIDSLSGLGVLEDLIDNENITDIMVNGRSEIYVEELGVGEYKTNLRFPSDAALNAVAMKIVNASGESLTTSKPYVDCKYPTMRINIVTGEICGQGIAISIRKFGKKVRITDQSMIETNQGNEDMVKTLEAFVKAGLNMLIVGPTGSGKTELLKYLVKHIEDNERFIMLEDTAETRLKDIYPDKHIVSMECRFTGSEESDVDYPVLLKNALRQNPARIGVGECRGDEAVHMIEIYNTGHEGGMTTGHSNSAADGVKRLVQMCLRSGMKLDPDVIGEWVTSTFDIVIFQKKMKDQHRRIREIIELRGYEDNKPIYTTLYKMKIDGHEQVEGRKQILCSHHQKGFLSIDVATKLYEAGIDIETYKHLVSDEDKEELGIV
ncbi:CpaF family protein [Cytobacillus sp. IB215665]|uniref:CpaF family protein n=1 Tax=Cytobacillus sp. IB215665 TaxID=3097357 RepID=UPI002A171253|nr:ATPase, T2SS/T4P/T4SS family [Cytobacillus sp. IB215665]MDX8367196.1 ATPase, T2SS/T4P/T4SS family [Cytobacillus sp. IB215665]